MTTINQPTSDQVHQLRDAHGESAVFVETETRSGILWYCWKTGCDGGLRKISYGRTPARALARAMARVR